MTKQCCLDPNNLVLTSEDDTISIHTCKVCNCRHFTVTVDPGHIGIVTA